MKKISKRLIGASSSRLKKQVSLAKNLTKKQLALQKILVKKASETVMVTNKKSDIDYHIKLTKELKILELRWEAFTEISWK